MNITLLDITNNAETLVGRCAAVCYKSAPKEGDALGAFIRSLVKRGHTSVLEHAKATFLVEGCSRIMTHQLVRHRLASFSQESQRYVEGIEDAVMPRTIKEDEKAEALFNASYIAARHCYEALRNLGIPKEDARFVLPNGAETRIAVTANFREWRTIIDLRADPHAQWEIREFANRVLRILHHHAPNAFADLAEKYGLTNERQ